MSGGVDVAGEATDLLEGLLAEPWGQASASIYETGRLVSLAPWLAGHTERIEYLLETQRADGAWGAPPAGYALGPTLSATEAMLAVLAEESGTACCAVRREDLVAAADRALRTLSRWFDPTGDGHLTRDELPDLPAIELITPSLTAMIERRLAEAPPGLDGWSGRRIGFPAGLDDTMLRMVRSRLAAGLDVPRKLVHALEVAGPAAAGNPKIVPESTGTVGAAPAATAAWLGDRVPDPRNPARRYLERTVRRQAGPVPCTLPFTVFERAWVLSWLLRAGIEITVPPELARSLRETLGPDGTAAAAGLPVDADTTAGAVYALGLLGTAPNPAMLIGFETDSHFCTWRGEDGFSVSTNAHVLEAFGRYLEQVESGQAAAAAAVPDYLAIVGKVSSWLRDRQRADGSWLDRWHASPYYATYSCAVALSRYGGVEASVSVRRARRWVIETQRADGSWGVWRGTPEETAYAMQTLLLTNADTADETESPAGLKREPGPAAAWGPVPAGGSVADPVATVTAGRDYLLRSPQRADDPAMWHDKDLYLPTAIVRAAILGALHTAGRP